jgi:cyclic pyranopterin phosphate synthase
MFDNYEREIDYLRISLTEKCNLRCIYCMPNGYQCKNEEILTLDDYKSIIRNFSKLGIKKIRFTGGEPLMYKNLEELIKFSSSCNIKTIAMTTNAINLAEKLDLLKKSGLTHVNISIDSLNSDKYKKITGGGNLQKVLNAIDKALTLGIKVKLNCVFIKDMNDDDFLDLINLTKNKPIDVRFIELMPIGEGKNIFKRGFIDLGEKILSLDNLKKCSEDKKSVAKYYKLENALGRVGIITPMSCSFCKLCNRIRLTSQGKLKLCLHSKEEIDLKPYLDDDEKFINFIEQIIKTKPKEHNLLSGESQTNRAMYQIGG